MLSLLQTLVDKGVSKKTLAAVLKDLIEANADNNGIDQRSYVTYVWALDYRDLILRRCWTSTDNVVQINGTDYLILTDDESTTLCRGAIVESLCTIQSDFLSEETGIDQAVFESFADSCSVGSLSTEAANAAILALIKGSCGFDNFANTVIGGSERGRGRFLARKDGVEVEYITEQDEAWYIYQLN